MLEVIGLYLAAIEAGKVGPYHRATPAEVLEYDLAAAAREVDHVRRRRPSRYVGIR